MTNYDIDESHSKNDTCVAVCGNVDAGKSTLVGVLTSGILDNGRGNARSQVFAHKHEIETGRTSSVTRKIIIFDKEGNGVQCNENGKKLDWEEKIGNSFKIVSLVDLAGHEKYLKLTVYGFTGNLPDYCVLVVGANMGITRMTREHLGIAFSLRIPVIIVITKIDLCPPEILKQTLNDIKLLLKTKNINKMYQLIQTESQIQSAVKHLPNNDRFVPLFKISSVTGEGIDLLRRFLFLLPRRLLWDSLTDAAAEVPIEQTYSINGVGTVVCGTVTSGAIEAGQKLLLGPDKLGHFKPVVIKSVESNRVPISQALPGQCAGFALKKIPRKEIRQGMYLIDASLNPQATRVFEADVSVLSSSTTFKKGYQPVVQCVTLTQTAEILEITDKEILRTGERARILFRFLFNGEYLKVGMRLILREGHCKAIGIITKLLDQNG